MVPLQYIRLNPFSDNLISSWNRWIKFIMKCDDVYEGMEGVWPSCVSHSHPIHQHAWLTWTRVCTLLDTWYIYGFYRIFTLNLYIYCIYILVHTKSSHLLAFSLFRNSLSIVFNLLVFYKYKWHARAKTQSSGSGTSTIRFQYSKRTCKT